MRKLLYIVLDGVGDRPHPDLEGKTPLEAAETPHLDTLASRGRLGRMHTVGEGIAPESDIAVISILGYDAHRYYTGRGPLESYAAGLEVREGDLAYRVNFATVGEGKRIRDRRVGRDLTSEEAALLCREVNEKVRLTSVPATFQFRNTVGHRGVLVLRREGGRLSGFVTNTDPAYGRKGVFGVAKETFEEVVQECRPMEGYEDLEEARVAALLTNEFIEKSHQVLEASEVNRKRVREGKLPANLILSRDGGDRLPDFPDFRERFGLRLGSFVEMPVERGIALLTGMEIVEIEGLTGDPHHDYPLLAERSVEELPAYNGLYIHIKGPDVPGHDGDAEKKKEIIEAIDSLFFGNLLPRVDLEKTIVTVTADHSTPCTLRAHSPDSVPLLVTGGKIPSDGISTFGEGACEKGSLGTLLGPELMPLLIRLCRE
jgi:2,3-bisphosphoglycerate-independent phosphoglycerate mutase